MKRRPVIKAEEIKRRFGVRDVLRYFNYPGRIPDRDKYVIRSPLREDRRPSFSVNETNSEGDLWYDHGLNEGGDVITLWQMITGTRAEFWEVLEEMAEVILGISSGDNSINSAGEVVETEAMGWSGDREWSSNLEGQERGGGKSEVAGDGVGDSIGKYGGVDLKLMMREERNKARKTLAKEEVDYEPIIEPMTGLKVDHKYFRDKEILKETVEEFGAGYAETGEMRRRIVFPVRDARGTLWAYVARSLYDWQVPYPYWSPEGFRKSEHLFNLDRVIRDFNARHTVNRYGIIVVEGFADAMKLHQEGFPNVVATMGCNMSERQAMFLRNRKINPTGMVKIFYDNDGKKGTLKGMETAQELLTMEVENDGSVIPAGRVEFIDYSKIDLPWKEGACEPEHFIKYELEVLLGQPEIEKIIRRAAWVEINLRLKR